MAWLISLLGAVLAVAGAFSLGNGAFYIRLDWGQAETVAGAVALSGGIVTIGLAALLFALRDIARRPPRSATSGVGFEALTPLPDREPPAQGRFPPAPVAAALPEPDRIEPSMGEIPAEVTPAVHDLDEPFVDSHPLRDPPLRAAPPIEPAPTLLPRERPVPRERPAPLQRTVAEAPAPIAPAAVEAPTVVGRYEANGASYVLFSDGTIEVETESGTHRFASMSALKDHIERQEAV